jgi:hypothetical protein
MFGVSLGIRVGNTSISGGGVPIDTDAQAYFDRVTTAGGTLTTTEKTAVNQLVIDLKANSLWTPMKAIYPMVGSSAAACAQNLKSSSFTGTFSSGWTFASTGVTPNGTSSYMSTGFSINTEQASANNYTHGFYSGSIGGASATRCSMGALTVGSESDILIRWSLGNFYANICEQLYNNAIINNDTHGFYVANRNTTNRTQSWKNGVKIVDIINVPSSKTTDFIIIGARNDNGTPNFFDNKRCQFAFMGDSLSDANQTNFYTAVQAFQTTLSRNV